MELFQQCFHKYFGVLVCFGWFCFVFSPKVALSRTSFFFFFNGRIVSKFWFYKYLHPKCIFGSHVNVLMKH